MTCTIDERVVPANPNSGPKPPATIVREQLTPYLGPFTATNAVQMMAQKIGGANPDSLGLPEIPAMLEALGPMLRTLLGKAGAEKVVGEIRWKLGL